MHTTNNELALHISPGETRRLWFRDNIGIDYSSPDSAIATVTNKGVVQGVSEGVVIIRAEQDGQAGFIHVRVGS